MNIFPSKPKRTPGCYYFGEFDEFPLAPFSVSVATFDLSFEAEPKHYHKKNQKAYLTIQGKGVLNVDGKMIELKPDQMIHVEPKEVHFIEKITKAPLKVVVILASKADDKVVV